MLRRQLQGIDLIFRCALLPICLFFLRQHSLFFSYNALNPMLRVFSSHRNGVIQTVTEGVGPSEVFFPSGSVMLRPPFLTGRENKLLSVVVKVFLSMMKLDFLISFSGFCRYSSMSSVVLVYKTIWFACLWYTLDIHWRAVRILKVFAFSDTIFA